MLQGQQTQAPVPMQGPPQGAVPGPPQSLEDMSTLQNQPSAPVQDTCGPMPPKPNYYSPQSVRDAFIAWQMCKSGA